MYLHSPTVRPKCIVRLSEDPLIQDSLNDGEALDGNDSEMGRCGSGVADLVEEKGYNWFWFGVGLQSVENNRKCGGVEG